MTPRLPSLAGPAWGRWLPWLPALTAALLLVTLQTIVTVTVGRDLEARALGRVAQAARLFADQVARVLARRHAELALFARDADLADDRPRARQREALHRLKDLSGSYYWIGVVELDGTVRVATDALIEGQSVATRPVFAEALKVGAYVGPPHPAAVLGLAAAARGMPAPGALADVSVPLLDDRGQVRAVLAAHLSASHFDGLRALVLGQAANRRELDVALVGHDGATLVGRLPPLDEPVLSASLARTSGDATRVRAVGGSDVVLAQSAVAGPRSELPLEWKAVATQPLDAALAPVLRLQQTLWLVGGAAALLLGGLGAWLSRRLSRPLTDMLHVVGERLGPDAPLSTAGYLQVLTEQMRRLPPARQRSAPGERMLDQLVHDAGRLHAVLDRLPAPMYLVDMAGRVVFWNQRAAEAFGWPAAEAVGRRVDELIPVAANSRLAVDGLRRRLRDEPGPWELEGHIHTRYGGEFWGRWHLSKIGGADGAPLGVLALVRDLTAETRAAAQQREQAELLAGIVESANDAIVSIGPDGRISVFNPAAERVFGYPAASMIGQPLDRLLPPDVIGRHAADVDRFAQSQTSRRPMGRGVVRGVRADGKVLQLEAAISQVTVARRQVLTAILRDVTERMVAERALAASREELAELTRRLMAQEKETTEHLAQLLHDRLGQTLVAARMTGEALMRAMGERWPADQSERARHLGALLADAQREVRVALVELRPPFLDEDGLASALETEVRRRLDAASSTQLRLDVEATARGCRWPADVEHAAFMVAREALANALLHAQAGTIVVALAGDETVIDLEVRDDGVGLADGALAPRPGHLGLVGMRERAAAVGAAVSVQANNGPGTLVRFRWQRPA